MVANDVINRLSCCRQMHSRGQHTQAASAVKNAAGAHYIVENAGAQYKTVNSTKNENVLALTQQSRCTIITPIQNPDPKT